MSISLRWLEHIHTPETINELGGRVSYYPDMWAYDVAYCPLWILAYYTVRILFEWAYEYLSYGGLNAWSIWTMPAILRIFVYQTDASLSVLGQCGSYGQGGVGGADISICNTYAVRTL